MAPKCPVKVSWEGIRKEVTKKQDTCVKHARHCSMAHHDPQIINRELVGHGVAGTAGVRCHRIFNKKLECVTGRRTIRTWKPGVLAQRLEDRRVLYIAQRLRGGNMPILAFKVFCAKNRELTSFLP